MPSRLLRRPAPALFGTALASTLALGLVGCSGGGSTDPDASGSPAAETVACTPSGAASDAVEVSGELGSAPDVVFEPGLEITSNERTVAIEGDGDEVEDGDLVALQFSFYNSESGELVGASPYDGSADVNVTVGDEGLIAGISDIVRCSTIGSRVVGVIDEANLADVPVVFVADVVREVPMQASGTEQELPDGFPAVEFADNGQPTLTIPDEEPPTELQIATLIVGDGPEVADGASVTVQYQGVNWRTGEVFDESWSRGAPSEFGTGQVIAGFGAALVGQTVGSRVMVIIPPDQGYGASGNSGAGIEGTDTLVFTVDILAAAN